ncbi:hypothetical protein K432DRAFT_428026 [Lepidopterella palustris CBS 459.81]|uniref:Uncharacterized protein n=1 Tax=Lepidopterella palustris CBS 459.81 TaxID=1314670 RepID=A0A8E2JCJ5_9PEZI|nr:hypothetical protein K432DRAFT_428026 [Lepidopterella palustris CBS 459.81]
MAPIPMFRGVWRGRKKTMAGQSPGCLFIVLPSHQCRPVPGRLGPDSTKDIPFDITPAFRTLVRHQRPILQPGRGQLIFLRHVCAQSSQRCRGPTKDRRYDFQSVPLILEMRFRRPSRNPLPGSLLASLEVWEVSNAGLPDSTWLPQENDSPDGKNGWPSDHDDSGQAGPEGRQAPNSGRLSGGHAT